MGRLSRILPRMIIAGLVSLTMLMTGCGSKPGESETASAEKTSPTHDTQPEGAEVALREANAEDFGELMAQHQGDVVLVDYWATW